eukprot:2125482-Prymnesium_polylepis.1
MATNVRLPEKTLGVKDGAAEALYVYPDGRVFWSRQTSFTLQCQNNNDRMPFDDQRCPFVMGLYSQTVEDVVLSWRSNGSAISAWDGSGGACMVQWIVTNLEQDVVTLQYAPGTYSIARAFITFSRIPNAFLMSYLLPAISAPWLRTVHSSFTFPSAAYHTRRPSRSSTPFEEAVASAHRCTHRVAHTDRGGCPRSLGLALAVMVFVSSLGFFIDPTATPARVALGIIAILVVLVRLQHTQGKPSSRRQDYEKPLTRRVPARVFAAA